MPSLQPVPLHSLKRLRHIPFDLCGYISNGLSFSVFLFTVYIGIFFFVRNTVVNER